MYRQRDYFFGLVLIFIFLSSCQRKPVLAPSADPFSAIMPPPMGATTYNDELTKELVILEELLTSKTDPKLLTKVQQALMSGNTDGLSADRTSYESHLSKILLTLPELVHPHEAISANRQLWLTAKFLFLKRRFVEAAIKMTDVLAVEPDFVEARNWRARAIFFLGNPDMAIAELNTIIAKSTAKSTETLDALYLIGAIVYESNDMNPARIATGIAAWQQYLQRSQPNAEMKKEIDESLAELKLRKEGKSKPTENLDPFSPSETYSKDKNAILVAFAKEELELARTLAEALLAKNYDNIIATVKARILFKTGQIEEAANLFASIVDKDKNFAPGYHYQGMAFMLRGDPKSAAASWRKVLAVDPAYGNAHGLMQRISVAESQ